MIESSHEPTGNLDSEAEAEVMKVLMNLNRQGKTIVFVTHSNEMASRADNIVYVHDSRSNCPSSKKQVDELKTKV